MASVLSTGQGPRIGFHQRLSSSRANAILLARHLASMHTCSYQAEEVACWRHRRIPLWADPTYTWVGRGRGVYQSSCSTHRHDIVIMSFRCPIPCQGIPPKPEAATLVFSFHDAPPRLPFNLPACPVFLLFFCRLLQQQYQERITCTAEWQMT